MRLCRDSLPAFDITWNQSVSARAFVAVGVDQHLLCLHVGHAACIEGANGLYRMVLVEPMGHYGGHPAHPNEACL